MDLSEFQLIKRIKTQFTYKNLIETGIGDDCAVIPFSDKLSYLITTDALVEGIHFKLGDINWSYLGKKVVAVNLSDIAAMGGRTKYLFISIAIPKRICDDNISQFFYGIRTALDEYNVLLLGGDTTGSNNQLFISITAIGIANSNRVIYRSGAKLHDFIYVTGTLGDSSGGLSLLKKKCSDFLPEENSLVYKHLNPVPRLIEISYLVDNYVINSAIDISDGLSNDLCHITSESGVGAKVYWDDIPKSKELINLISEKDLSYYVLDGGEDYELLFTSPDRIDANSFYNELGTRLSCIGRITSYNKNILIKDGAEQLLIPRGFDHFKV